MVSWDHASVFTGGRLSEADIEKALTYPYWSPRASFLVNLDSQGYSELSDAEAAAYLAGRRPCLAIGSNASPEQLLWKFTGHVQDPLLVVTPVHLHGFDVVYANRLSRYGAIPATLVECPGTAVAVKLIWCTDEQYQLLNASESLGTGYHHEHVPVTAITASKPVQSALQGQTRLDYYKAAAGPILVNQAPVALEAIRAEARAWPAATEQEMLALLAELTNHSSIEAMLEVATAAGGSWDKFNQQLQARPSHDKDL